MFVRKDGNSSGSAPEHFDDRLHQLVAGIEVLTPFVIRIIAMLADEADCIHGQVFASKRHRIFDGGVNFEPVLLRKATAEIVRRSLSRIHRYQPGTRRGEDAVWRIALKQSSHNYGRMRVKTMILRVHG